MTCRSIDLGNGVVGIVCGRREGPPKPCIVPGCGKPHARLCDWPVLRRGKPTTCDLKLCEGHATKVGELDYCPAHARAHAGRGPHVINRHHYTWEPGFGDPPKRASATPPLPTPRLYIGRGTPLGNPFRHEEHGDATLELYRRHLWAAIKANDRAVLDELASITEAHHLVCSCSPRPCHGDIVVRAWEWCRDRGMLRPAR